MLNAQSNAFGAKVTPMLSWAKLKPNDAYTYESAGKKPSIGFGPSYKKYFGENFNIDLSLLFTWQHSEFTAESLNLGSQSDKYLVSPFLRYVQLPVNFEAGFSITQNLKGLIDFGFAPAVELESVATLTHTDASGTIHDPIDFNYKGSAFNLYLSAGAGVMYHVTDELGISGVVLYNNGVIDTWFDDTDSEYLPELELYNHYISLNVGLYIKF